MLVKLKDYLDVRRGPGLPSEFYSETGKLIRLTLGNFNYPNGGFKENTSKKDIFYIGNIKKEFILKKGDLITPLTEQVSGLLGETAWIPESNKYIQNGDIGLVIPYENKLNAKYCYYLLSSHLIKKQLGDGAQQTKIRHTSPDKIKACVAPIPDIKNQELIGNLLYSIDEQINRNSSMIKKLQVLGKTIYSKNIKKIKFDKLENISNVATGKEDANHSTENGKYKFFTCSDETLSCDDFKFEGKSILVAGNGNFNVKYYDGKFNAYQRTYVIKNDEIIGNLYYTLLFNTELFTKKANGSIIKFITINMLNNIDVPKFNDETNDVLNRILEQINSINSESDNLLELKSKLLPLLINQQLI